MLIELQSTFIARSWPHTRPARQPNLDMYIIQHACLREAIQLSIPFLIFELCYVLTRMVLRSIGDAWVPTALTITCLNGGGLVLTWLLFSFYQPSIKSIIFALTGCTLILMTCLLVRFFKITGSRHRALFNQ
ncbi:hypothetical protein D3C71_1633930 [compost metagenome]